MGASASDKPKRIVQRLEERPKKKQFISLTLSVAPNHSLVLPAAPPEMEREARMNALEVSANIWDIRQQGGSGRNDGGRDYITNDPLPSPPTSARPPSLRIDMKFSTSTRLTASWCVKRNLIRGGAA